MRREEGREGGREEGREGEWGREGRIKKKRGRERECCGVRRRKTLHAVSVFTIRTYMYITLHVRTCMSLCVVFRRWSSRVLSLPTRFCQ